jgi:hypothetical protein
MVTKKQMTVRLRRLYNIRRHALLIAYHTFKPSSDISSFQKQLINIVRSDLWNLISQSKK